MHYFTNKEYSIYLSIAGVSYLIGGIIAHLFVEPGEPWWTRLLLVVPGIMIAAYIYRNNLPEKMTHTLVYICLLFGTTQYLYYSTLNRLNDFYAWGLFPLVLACIIFINLKPILILYLIITNIFLTLLVLFIDVNRYYPLLFNFYSFSIIIYIFQLQKINLFNHQSQAFENLKSSKKEIENIYSLNIQASRDLDKPVLAIKNVADKVKYEDPKLYRLLETSMNRISEISADLISTHRKNKEIIESNFFDLENNISQLVSDKRKEYSSVKNLFIFYRVTAPLLQGVNLPKSEFQRIFSSLISYSIDALKECTEKRIKITITPLDKFTEIIIANNGRGIEKDKLDQIFTNDLELNIAKKTLEKWGGNIQLVKTGSRGTSFRLQLPNQKGSTK